LAFCLLPKPQVCRAASEMFPHPAPFLPSISAAMLRSPVSRAPQAPQRGSVARSSRGEREPSRLTLSRRPHFTETTAWSLARHTRHRTRALRSSTLGRRAQPKLQQVPLREQRDVTARHDCNRSLRRSGSYAAGRRGPFGPDGYMFMFRMSAPLSCGGADGGGRCPAAQPARIKRTNATVSQLESFIALRPVRSGSGHCS
jgi:hypothetical protein